jgi:peptidyl-prolyl cis-trans isomerase SurA
METIEMRAIRALLCAACVAMPFGPATGQNVQRIAAIVNDEVISAHDLLARIRLVIVSTRLRDTPKTRQRIAPQVLRALIDERLQLQEAKRRNVSVTKRDLRTALSELEKRNNVPAGNFAKFLRRNNMSPDTVLAQIRAGIAWSKLVRRRLRPRVTIGEDEVDEAFARLEANRGKTEYRLSEIFLTIDSPQDEPRVRREADRLAEQIRGGAKFGALARQFSQSASAAVYGDLGWIAESDLGPELSSVALKIGKGEVATPIRSVSGYRILMLQGRRKIAAADASKVKLSLKQIFLPVPKNALVADVTSHIDLAKTVRGSMSGCESVDSIAKEVGSSRPAELGTFQLSDLSPLIRTAVDDLEVGQPSQPVRMPGGVAVLMVCQRVAPEVKLPGREEISDQLVRRRLDMMARRYLRDIRRAAVVDVRI